MFQGGSEVLSLNGQYTYNASFLIAEFCIIFACICVLLLIHRNEVTSLHHNEAPPFLLSFQIEILINKRKLNFEIRKYMVCLLHDVLPGNFLTGQRIIY